MNFPIKLKHVTLREGFTQIQKVGDLELRGYVLEDAQNVTLASGTSLANLFEYGLQLDAGYELMHQFIDRGYVETQKHLKNIDCDDAGPQLDLPGFEIPGGGPILQ